MNPTTFNAVVDVDDEDLFMAMNAMRRHPKHFALVFEFPNHRSAH